MNSPEDTIIGVKILRDFSVYSADTNASIINRIASRQGTIPSYLIIIDEKTPLFNQLINGKLAVYNIIENIKLDVQDNDRGLPGFSRVNIPLIQEKTDIDVNDKIIPLFVYYTLRDKEDDLGIGFRKIEVGDFLKESGYDKLTVNGAMSRGGKIDEQIQRDIEKNNKHVSRHNQLLDAYKKFREDAKTISLETSPLDIIRTVFEVTLDANVSDTEELFNKLVTTSETPLASFKNYHKILKNIDSGLPDLVQPEEGAIHMYTKNKQVELDTAKSKDKHKMYKLVLIDSYTDEDLDEMLQIKFATRTIQEDEQFDQEITRLTSVFRGFQINRTVARNVSSISAEFYVKNISIDTRLFTDMIMTDPLFSKIMVISENLKMTKIRKNVFIYYNHTDGNVSKIVITPKYSDDPRMMTTVPLDTEYAHVRIRHTANQTHLSLIMTEMIHIFKMYSQRKDAIANTYKSFIQDFQVSKATKGESKVTKRGKIFLKDKAPEIFLDGYAKICTNTPNIISDEEAANTERVVMKFPRADAGMKQKNYVCESKIYKFPGLRVNPLDNSDKLPYLPCCYTNNQRNEKGKAYRHYFYDEPLEDEKFDPKMILASVKFAKFNQYGELQSNLLSILRNGEYNKETYFLRRGVHYSPSSFLECIIRSVNPGLFSETTTNTDVLKVLSEFRKRLSSDTNLLMSIYQQIYTENDNDIREMIADDTIYFDPRLFTPLLEEYFNCDIYVFGMSKSEKDSIILPRYTNGLYTGKRDRNSVIVIENKGGHADKKRFPMCEQVVRRLPGNENLVCMFFSEPSRNRGTLNVSERLHNENKEYIRNIRSAYEKYNETFVNNKLLSHTGAFQKIIKQLESRNVTIKSQILDSYGKARGIVCEYQGDTASLMPAIPFAPLNLERATKMDGIPVTNEETAKTIMRSVLGIENTRRVLLEGRHSEIKGCVRANGDNVDDLEVSIPIVTDESFNTLKEGEITNAEYSHYTTDISHIEMFNRHRRNARHITQYMFWAFSKFINTGSDGMYKLDTDGNVNKAIVDFVNKNVSIGNTQEELYNNIQKTFTYDSAPFVNGKIRMRSREMMKRLAYTLRLACLRDREIIENFYKNKKMKNFYTSIADFDMYKNQVIVMGEDAPKNFIKRSLPEYAAQTTKVYSSIPSFALATMTDKHKRSFFFKNNQVLNGHLCLAQPCDKNLPLAFSVSKSWLQTRTHKLDQRVKEKSSIDSDFILYAYTNDNDMIAYHVSETHTASPPANTRTEYGAYIIGALHENKKMFVSLMPM